MEIVVAALGLRLGILTPTRYAVVVLVAIVTSVMTPPLLRRALARLPAPPAGPS
jgi:predicted Kef-type K+ transport protein